jgi:hypothetical protein
MRDMRPLLLVLVAAVLTAVEPQPLVDMAKNGIELRVWDGRDRDAKRVQIANRTPDDVFVTIKCGDGRAAPVKVSALVRAGTVWKDGPVEVAIGQAFTTARIDETVFGRIREIEIRRTVAGQPEVERVVEFIRR